jgi:hypothetical protein
MLRSLLAFEEQYQPQSFTLLAAEVHDKHFKPAAKD